MVERILPPVPERFGLNQVTFSEDGCIHKVDIMFSMKVLVSRKRR